MGEPIIARIPGRVGLEFGEQPIWRQANPAPEFLGETLVVSDMAISYIADLEF